MDEASVEVRDEDAQGEVGKVSGVTVVTVLGKGQEFLYVVPSFPVCKATLQEVKLCHVDDQGNACIFDAFAKKCNLLDHPLLAIAIIQHSYLNGFLIDVSS